MFLLPHSVLFVMLDDGLSGMTLDGYTCFNREYMSEDEAVPLFTDILRGMRACLFLCVCASVSVSVSACIVTLCARVCIRMIRALCIACFLASPNLLHRALRVYC